jgi:hypothetical protein
MTLFLGLVMVRVAHRTQGNIYLHLWFIIKHRDRAKRGQGEWDKLLWSSTWSTLLAPPPPSQNLSGPCNSGAFMEVSFLGAVGY